MRAVALVGCLVLAVFVPQPPQPTDTDVPPASLVSGSVTTPEVAEPEELLVTEQEVPPPPPMMADGIDTEPPPVTAARVSHGCDAAAEMLCTQDPPPRPVWNWCEEWHDMADQIGWPESQGYVLSYVMHRESKCRPGAYNPTPCGSAHALGLMQLCGWPCPPNGCFDPWSNLQAAYNLWQHSGWCPWVLRGDPVTGRACG